MYHNYRKSGAVDSSGGPLSKQSLSFSLKLKVTVQDLLQLNTPTEGKRVFCVFEVTPAINSLIRVEHLKSGHLNQQDTFLPLKSGHLNNQDTFLPLKSGHLNNQDTFLPLKSGHLNNQDTLISRTPSYP